MGSFRKAQCDFREKPPRPFESSIHWSFVGERRSYVDVFESWEPTAGSTTATTTTKRTTESRAKKRRRTHCVRRKKWRLRTGGTGSEKQHFFGATTSDVVRGRSSSGLPQCGLVTGSGGRLTNEVRWLLSVLQFYYRRDYIPGSWVVTMIALNWVVIIKGVLSNRNHWKFWYSLCTSLRGALEAVK